MHNPPRVYYKQFFPLSACTYYRVEVPLRSMHRAGLADVTEEEPLSVITPDDIQQSLVAMANHDLVVFYATGGSSAEAVQRFLRMMPNEERADGVFVTPPSFIEDLDDNLDWVHPLNPRFIKIGTRTPVSGRLTPGESVNIIMQDGEVVPVWEDLVTKNEAGEVFDIKRNQKGVDSFNKVLRRCQGVSFASERLRDYYVQNYGLKNTYWYPNSVIFEDYPEIRLRKDSGVIRVLWQGGDSHYADWFSIRGALKEAAEKFPEIRWVIWGKMFGWIHDVIPRDKIEYHQWVPYEAYKIKLSSMDFDIALAPLVENEFNAGKSCIKWYEASALAEPRPVLAAGVAPYSDEMEDGETGLLYKSPEEFVEKLGRLVASASERQRLASNAKDWVRENRGADKTIKPYFEWMRDTHAGFQKRRRTRNLRVVRTGVPAA